MKSSVSWLGEVYSPDIEHRHGRAEDGAESAQASILVVDDDLRMRQSVRDLLATCGYRCTLADGGGEALKLLGQQRIDLMLLDLHMPGIDGYTVMQQVAERFPDTGVVVISGETTFESATEVLRHGVQDFLRKPYEPDELMRVVNNVLHKRRLESNIREVHRRLEASEQRYRFIVNNSPDIIFMLDQHGRFAFVNERITTLLGYQIDEVMGRHYSEIVHAEDLEKARFAFDEKAELQPGSKNVELRLLCRSASLPYCYFESRSITIDLNSMGAYSEAGGQSGGRLLGTYGVARDISERKRAEEIINYQLYHDLLTKLPNRVLFRDRLNLAISHARRNDSQLAVMYLDMDRFKIINDSLGHLAGEQLLQMVATRLHGCLRDSDTLARVGGDEFNLLVTEIAGREDAAMIADKVIEKLQQPLLLEGYEVFVSFSIGIALFPGDGQNMDALIKNADMAMYYTKSHGKNGYEFFSGSMKGAFKQYLSMENGMRKALEARQFELFYQPQVDVCDGGICGMEALLRWRHPQRGLILPDEFILLAEETGLIIDIDRWVLESACAELRRWIDAGSRNVVLAVNISATQLAQPDFEDRVMEALQRYGIPGRQLELEITENILMQDMDQAVHRLKRLSSSGVRIAVDDFGIGYSSLGYLQALPLHTLKIDRSFIHTIQSVQDVNSIVTAIFAMAKELRLEVVAEGVENDAQVEFLRKLNCPKAQGFLLGRPIEALGARQLLQGQVA
jgi:diguanylate cyclase (GGDEF)-like protein